MERVPSKLRVTRVFRHSLTVFWPKLEAIRNLQEDVHSEMIDRIAIGRHFEHWGQSFFGTAHFPCQAFVGDLSLRQYLCFVLHTDIPVTPPKKKKKRRVQEEVTATAFVLIIISPLSFLKSMQNCSNCSISGLVSIETVVQRRWGGETEI